MTDRAGNDVQGPVKTGTDGPVPRRGRIVVGVDGSSASVVALRWACAEARLRDMGLHIVHVRDRKAGLAAPYAPGAGRGAAGRAAPESALKALVDEALGSAARPVVQLEFADGLPARVLVDRAAGAAMLVLGSTRSGGPDAAPVGKPSAPLGPVARDCLRAAPCPVVIVTDRAVLSGAELAVPQPVGGGGRS